jgi:hypothetical protein
MALMAAGHRAGWKRRRKRLKSWDSRLEAASQPIEIA